MVADTERETYRLDNYKGSTGTVFAWNLAFRH